MDSEPSVSLSPAKLPIPPSPSPPPRAPLSSHEDSSDSSSSPVEDEYETASDPEEADSAAPEPTRLTRKASMPIAPVTRDDDVEGEAFEEEMVDGSPGFEGKGEALGGDSSVSGGNPNREEDPKDGDMGIEEKEQREDLGVSGEATAKGGSLPEDSVVGEAVEAEPEPTSGSSFGAVDGAKVHGVPDALDENDENLGGGESEAAPNAVTEDSKPVEVEKDDVGVVAGVEAEKYDVGVVAGEGVEKEDVGAVAGVEESGAPSAPEEIDENLGGKGEEVAASAVLEGDADLRPQVESYAVGAEKDGGHEGEIEIKPAKVESDAGEAEKDGASESASPEQIPEGAVDLKPVESDSHAPEVDEIGAADSSNSNRSLDGAEEMKPVEEEYSALGAETIGATDSLDADQMLDGGAKLKAADTEPNSIESEKTEKTAVADDAVSNRSLEVVTVPTSESMKLDSTELQSAVGGAEKGEGLDESSISVDSSQKLDVVNGGASGNQQIDDEKAATDSESVSNGLEAKPSEPEPEPAADGGELISNQEVESPSPPTLAEDSKRGGAEGEMSEISVAPENGNAREISVESLPPIAVSDRQVKPDADGSQEADDDENVAADEAEEEEDGASSDKTPRVAILDSSETAKQLIKEMEEGSSSTSSRSGFSSSRDYSRHMDGQIVTDSDEEVDDDEEGDGKELFDSSALAALLKAATGASSDSNITITSQDGTRVFSVDRPAGLGSSAPSLRPAPPRSNRPTIFNPSELAVAGEPENNMDEEAKKLHDKVEQIRVKFLRLVLRLGHTPEDTVAAQVLYRLSLAEGIRSGRQIGRAFSIEGAKKKALQHEEDGLEDLNFSCNILVIGKTGVGKSATINSIFGEEKSHTSAFELATTSVREISGIVDGVKVRVIDTPGLRSSVMEQAANRKILLSIKKYTKRFPPDIVLYVDRLDTQTRDLNDLPLLRTITSVLGSSIWFNAIVALTHAASAPPDGPNGSPLSYEVFIAQRSHVVQHSIRQAAGDMRLMNPVALVENHPSCRRNREGERVLPNGLSWRPQLLLLCYSSKILSEANSLLKLQDPSPGKLFGLRLRSPPLPFLLSSLLQSRPHPKLSTAQGGDEGDSDVDLDDFSDTEEEEQDEYDQLPPFKPLKKTQIAKLTKEQKRAYFDEYDYRVKLLQKKQWKEELRRLKEMKKGKSTQDDSPYGGTAEDYDDGAPAAVPVPLPDMVLPPSFDCDIPTYRYRFLEPSSQLLTRPVLDTHGWDHDCGYDGVSLEENLAIVSRFPAAVSVQITKDKKDFNIHLDSSVSAKHGENGSTLAGFDIQSIGKQLAYILRGETKFKNLKKNKTTAGISVTFLGENVATGMKIEDQVSIGKRVCLVASTGAIRSQGDVAYGANLEARLREKDYPIGQALSTLGLSLMKWRGDLALGANLQSQFSTGRNSKMAVRVGLNNKLSGQITVRTSTSEQLQLALVSIVPIVVSIYRSIWPGESYLVH